MKNLAKAIRKQLKYRGYSNRQVSVQCSSSWVITVARKDLSIDKVMLRDLVRTEYHREPHSWLCVNVDGYHIPMPDIEGF